MEKVDASGLLMFGALFAGGLYFLVVGEDPIFGMMAMLTAGGFMLMAAMPLFRSRWAAPVRIALLDGEPCFVLDTAKGKEIVLQVALFGLAAGAAAMVAGGEPRGWVPLVCSVPVALWWSWKVYRGGRAITLTPTRVVLTTDGKDELAWAEIKRVLRFDSGDSPMLAIGQEDVQIDQFVACSDDVERIVTLYFEGECPIFCV